MNVFSLIISLLSIILPIAYFIVIKFNKNIVSNIMDYKYNLKCLSCDQKFELFDNKTGVIRYNNYKNYFLCDVCVKENNKFERNSKLSLLISDTLKTKITNFFSKFKFKLRKFFLNRNDFKFILISLILMTISYTIYFIIFFEFKIKLDILLIIGRLALVFYWISKVTELFVFK